MELAASFRARKGNVRLMLPSDSQLLQYLDDVLPPEITAQLESLLRQQPELRARLMALSEQRDQGGHTLGEIWRRERLSCIPRHELGNYLLGTAQPAWRDYIRFHVQEMGCRVCLANLHDLQQSEQEQSSARQGRQRRYFETSAGTLRTSQASRASQKE
jgi:hypothetical protein